MKSITIKIAIEWMEQDGDCRPCMLCGDIIVGKMYTMVMFIGEDAHEESKTKSLCQPCKELINDSNSNK